MVDREPELKTAPRPRDSDHVLHSFGNSSGLQMAEEVKITTDVQTGGMSGEISKVCQGILMAANY